MNLYVVIKYFDYLLGRKEKRYSRELLKRVKYFFYINVFVLPNISNLKSIEDS